VEIFNIIQEKDYNWHSLLCTNPVFPDAKPEVDYASILVCVQVMETSDTRAFPGEEPYTFFDYQALPALYFEERKNVEDYINWKETWSDCFERTVAWKYIEPFKPQEVKQ